MPSILCGAVATIVTVLAATASADPPASQADDIPLLVRDKSAGDWVVDRFVGNSTAGSKVFQGPAC